MSIYDINVLDQNNNEVSLAKYKGKVLLIVNTATQCGFTPQYNALQTMYEKYKDQGFEILDFPCNQFGGQAPGTNEEINMTCQLRFKLTFKQFSKIDVNGSNESELYKFLKKEQGGTLFSTIKWNFTKFLVDRNGNVVDRFAPTTNPESFEKDIVKLLEAK